VELLKTLDVHDAGNGGLPPAEVAAGKTVSKRLFRLVGTFEERSDALLDAQLLRQKLAEERAASRQSGTERSGGHRVPLSASKTATGYRADRANRMQEDTRAARLAALTQIRRVASTRPVQRSSAGGATTAAAASTTTTTPASRINLLELTSRSGAAAAAAQAKTMTKRTNARRGVQFPVVRSAREMRQASAASETEESSNYVMDYYVLDNATTADDFSLLNEEHVIVPVESFSEDLLDDDSLVPEHEYDEDVDEDDWENQEWDYPEEEDDQDDEDDDDYSDDDSHGSGDDDGGSSESDGRFAASSGSSDDAERLGSDDDSDYEDRFDHYGSDRMDDYDTHI
jgi:hypothetical protein